MHTGYVTFGEGIWSNLQRRQVVEVLCAIQLRSDEQQSITLLSFIPWYGYLLRYNELKEAKKELTSSGVNVITIPIPIPIPYYSPSSGLSSFWRYSWYAMPPVIMISLPVLLFYTIYSGIDLLHARSYPAALPCTITSKLISQTGLIFDPRSDFPEENVTSGNWSGESISFRFWKKAEKYICICSDSVIAISETFINHLNQQNHQINFDLVPNNVNMELFTPDKTFREKYRKDNEMENKTVLVYSGSMDIGSWNNPKEYAKAVKRIHSSKQDFIFLFLIPEESRDTLIKTFNKYNINEDIYRIEHPSYQEVPKYLSIGDFGIYILDEYSIRLGTKFVEYMAVGLPPIVNSNVGGASELIQNNDLGCVIKLFDGESTKDTYGSIEKLEKNKQIYKKRCMSYADSEFSTVSVADKYINIYKRVSN